MSEMIIMLLLSEAVSEVGPKAMRSPLTTPSRVTSNFSREVMPPLKVMVSTLVVRSTG